MKLLIILSKLLLIYSSDLELIRYPTGIVDVGTESNISWKVTPDITLQNVKIDIYHNNQYVHPEP